MTTRAQVDALIKSINADLGDGRTVIQRGHDISWATARRWSTGSLGLDIALNGGVPQGMIVQFMGEESSGKTTMAIKIAGVIQDALQNEAAIAFVSVEGFDKQWANHCGAAVPFSADELALMSKKDRELYGSVEEVGTFVVASATTGEDACELAIRFVASNRFQLVVLDSIGALVPQAEEEREMAEKTMGKQPALVSQFLKKLNSALSKRTEEDEANTTSVILINQVREVIGTYGHPEPAPPGGRALKHFCNAIVRFKRGELLKEGDADSKVVYGKRTKIKVEKSKIGPPYREAEFDFYFREHGEFVPGDIDTAQEIRMWAVRAGVIQQTSNTTYEYDGEKFRGKNGVEQWLRDNPEQMEDIRKQVLAVMTTATQ